MGIENYNIEEGNKSRKSSSKSLNTAVITLTNNLFAGDNKTDTDKDYKILQIVGEGTLSKVYEAQNRITDLKRALKIIKKTQNNIINEEEINNEINILKAIDHPNILKTYEFFSNNESYNIIMEYCKGGQLYTEIENNAPFDETYSAYVMYQIFSAINYAHNMNIIHRDLKPENILIVNRNKKNNYPNIKVGDFGMIKLLPKNTKQNKIIRSLFYVAPEVFKNNYNEKCDIWSCGVIMYTLLSNNKPFDGKNEDEIISKIEKGEFDLKSQPFDKISDNAKDLIQKLLIMDTEKRINAQEALNHIWFKENRSKELFNQIYDENVTIKLIDNLKKYKKTSIIQETALAYLVHNFPQMKDIINSGKLFNQIDLNGDGKISEQELYQGLSKRLKSDTLEEDVKKIFQNLDMDDSGTIEYEEFIRAAVTKEKFMGENVLRFAFRFFDKDNSGKIEFEEIEKIFKNSVTDQNNIESALSKIIYEVDSNRGGKISFREFCILMKKMLE